MEIGLSHSLSQLLTVVLKVISVAAVACSTYLVGKMGRRPMMVGGRCMTVPCWSLIMVLFFFLELKIVQIFAVLCFFGAQIIENLSVRPVSLLLRTELFPYQYRCVASSLFSLGHSVSFFAFTMAFWPMLVYCGGWAFILEIIPCALLLCYIWKKLPECRNISAVQVFEEMCPLLTY